MAFQYGEYQALIVGKYQGNYGDKGNQKFRSYLCVLTPMSHSPNRTDEYDGFFKVEKCLCTEAVWRKVECGKIYRMYRGYGASFTAVEELDRYHEDLHEFFSHIQYI